MKLINKKTRKIVENAYIRESYDPYNKRAIIAVFVRDGNHPPERVSTGYETLTELNAEWEDVPEEPKVGYIIDPMEEDCLSVDGSGYEESDVERAKELGIWFETEEEAKRAAKKLKAWKRLKDKGFRFNGYSRYDWNGNKSPAIAFEYPGFDEMFDDKQVISDLDICFGGEE